MKTRLIAKPNAKEGKTLVEDRLVPPDSLENALERSIHELILLAKYYQKHGYLRQAQEIYYYILSIQERRERRREPSKEGEKRKAKLQQPLERDAKINNRPLVEPHLKQIAGTAPYGMCTLKRS